MALNFPPNPSVGATYTQGAYTWFFNGVEWVVSTYTTVGFQGSRGITGYLGSVNIGYDGSIGFQGSTGPSIVTENEVTPPSDPVNGQLWWDASVGILSYYYQAQTVWLGVGAGLSGDIGYAGSIGYTGSVVATIPVNTKTTIYTAAATDTGKFISTVANVTISSGIFSPGETFSIYNSSLTSNISIFSSGVTVYVAGETISGTRTLTTNGFASVLCVATNKFIITGAGLG